MKDLLLYIARNLVDNPDAVSVTEVQGSQELRWPHNPFPGLVAMRLV